MRAWARLRRGLMTAVPAAGLLLIPAALVPQHQQIWTRALLLTGVLAVIMLGANIALATLRPASFEVRQARKTRGQPWIDAAGLVAYLVYLIAWVVFVPLDAGWLQLLPPPPTWLSAVGGLAAILGCCVAFLAVWQNRFASPNIEDQSDRGQQVVDSGLYGLVRHPLYAGNLLLFAGVALWMGSLAAFIGVSVHLAATLARIGIEERFLRVNLPAYAAYASRVRARLVPFLI